MALKFYLAKSIIVPYNIHITHFSLLFFRGKKQILEEAMAIFKNSGPTGILKELKICPTARFEGSSASNASKSASTSKFNNQGAANAQLKVVSTDIFRALKIALRFVLKNYLTICFLF
jgi:hypothetical protein